MDKETVEGLRLGTVLSIIAATLVIGSLVFWYAHMYAGLYFDKASAQNQQLQSVGLKALSTSAISDIPVASIYTVVSREWRAISAISVLDTSGTSITTAKTLGSVWVLTPALTKPDGVTVITSLVSPEQVLYAVTGKIYSTKLSGRAYVTVTQDTITQLYEVQVKLQQ